MKLEYGETPKMKEQAAGVLRILAERVFFMPRAGSCAWTFICRVNVSVVFPDIAVSGNEENKVVIRELGGIRYAPTYLARQQRAVCCMQTFDRDG